MRNGSRVRVPWGFQILYGRFFRAAVGSVRTAQIDAWLRAAQLGRAGSFRARARAAGPIRWPSRWFSSLSPRARKIEVLGLFFPLFQPG